MTQLLSFRTSVYTSRVAIGKSNCGNLRIYRCHASESGSLIKKQCRGGETHKQLLCGKSLGRNITINPYYGAYFPTRFDHLKLFDKWLKKYTGSKEKAIEIGVGSGILSYQLIKNGFSDIYASDTNKNA